MNAEERKKSRIERLKQLVSQKAFYTRQELADLLHCSIRTVDDWLHKGLLDRIKFGGSKSSKVLIPSESVCEFLEKGYISL